MDAKQIVEAYHWQRALGHEVIQTPYGSIIADRTQPDVWDANHVSAVTAEGPDEIDDLLTDMDQYLSHTRWRVVHTDPYTPDTFIARLALDGYVEQPPTIQMILERRLLPAHEAEIAPVETETDWQALAALVRHDHEEGARTGGMILLPDVTTGIIASYRAKNGSYRFHLARIDGEPVAYGALAAAPSGAGIIEDLFTLPAYRQRGIASAMIARFAAALNERGCTGVFIGAVVGEQARHLYAKLGFRPVMVTRCWVRRTP